MLCHYDLHQEDDVRIRSLRSLRSLIIDLIVIIEKGQRACQFVESTLCLTCRKGYPPFHPPL